MGLYDSSIVGTDSLGAKDVGVVDTGTFDADENDFGVGLGENPLEANDIGVEEEDAVACHDPVDAAFSSVSLDLGWKVFV